MKNIFKTFVWSMLLVQLIGIQACKKRDQKPADANSAKDAAIADNAFSGIWKHLAKTVSDSTQLRAAGTPTITITPLNPSVWPKTVVLNFGSTNMLCYDFVNRRGSITAIFSGLYTDSGTVITITPNNYYHNDYKIQGVQNIINKGNTSNGGLLYQVSVPSATITNPSGKNASWTTNQEREWFGHNTPLSFYDDVYKIRGSARGVSSTGDDYTITTITDLQVNVGCPYIVSGSFNLVMNSFTDYPIFFDYGPGTCDANATASLDGTTYNIVLP
jgi:hypothetical protein